MLRRRHLWITCCLGAWLGAGSPLPAQPAEVSPTSRPNPAKPDPTRACANWRWIGISRPGVRCPDIQGWTVRPLFPQLSPARSRSGEDCPQDQRENLPDLDLIRELNRFCVYEPESSAVKPSTFPSAGRDLVRADRDCAALAIGEKYSAEPRWPSSDSEVKALLLQAGKPEAPIKMDRKPGVRLAFLDTQPTGVGVPTQQGNSPHGFTLARLSHDLICNSGSPETCAALITTRLALPIIEFDPQNPTAMKTAPTRGGYFGMQSHLAQAIRDEVDSWRSETPDLHLVLNLSMAWDGNLFGGLNERQVAEMQAGVQAIYQALKYANSFDALVLAAAGNQKRDPCANNGPLLPAAWERGAPQDEIRGRRKEAPLLYAVGGLQADGQFLANARPGGMPRRAAYGETTIFAGSSVSTAVASSIAAVVWNAFPDLSSREVMAILDRQVKKNLLPNDADFWFNPSGLAATTPPKVQKLLLCSALETACTQQGGSSCPIPIPCRYPDAKALPASGIKAQKGSCDPWVRPQPEDNPCMACIKPPIAQ
jgi:hypothetical protein